MYTYSNSPSYNFSTPSPASSYSASPASSYSASPASSYSASPASSYSASPASSYSASPASSYNTPASYSSAGFTTSPSSSYSASPSPNKIRYNSPSSINNLSPTSSSNIYSVNSPTKTASVRPSPSLQVSPTIQPSPTKTASVRPSPVVQPSPSRSSTRTASVRPSPVVQPSPSRSSTRPSSQASSEPVLPLTFPARDTVNVNEDVENLLISNGYKPIKYIIVDNEQNKNFILATNKRGQYVLVNLNGKDTSIIGNIIHTEQVKNDSSNIPYSLRKGSLECSNGVCGIAYEGDKGLTTITRDHLSLEAKSDTLVYKGDNVATIGNNIPIPIINYNDIIHDPEGILYNTCETTKRLYAKAYENCKVGMRESIDVFRTLGETLNEFVSSENMMANKLAESMAVLNKIATQYERDPPINDAEHRSYDMVKFNLRKRNDLFIILVNCCNQVCSMKNDMVELTQNIREMQEMCEREFSGVDKVMTL